MSSFTESDVKKVIVRAVSAKAKIVDYKLDPFSAHKCGILGSHLILTVNVRDESNAAKSDQVKMYTFFVKLLGDVNELPKFVDAYVFEEEMNYYNNIQPLMLENYKGKKWFTECYFAEKNILILEDLRAQGYNMPTGLVIDEHSLNISAETLGRFHACSVLAERKLGKSLKNAFPNYLTEKVYNEEYNFGRCMTLSFKTIVLMAEKLNLDSKLVPHIYDYIYKSARPQDDEFNVLCHSDVWRNNILFNDSDAPILVDYQLLRYAPPAIDLSLLLYLNTSVEFRKTYDMEFLKHYYMVFEQTLQNSKIDIKIPSFECTLEKYHKYKIVGMATATNYLPAHFLKPDNFIKLLNDEKALEIFMTHDRMVTIEPELDKNLEYAKKVKALLSEFLDEGKRVLNFGNSNLVNNSYIKNF